MKLSTSSKTWQRRMTTGIYFYKGDVEFTSSSNEVLIKVLLSMSRAFTYYSAINHKPVPAHYLELHDDIYTHVHGEGRGLHIGNVMDELRQCGSVDEIQALRIKYPFVKMYPMQWNTGVHEVVAEITKSLLIKVDD